MTFIKRGLGRGLEVLLTDVANLSGTDNGAVESNEMDDQLTVAYSLIESLHTQNQNVLSEAEDLKNLLDDLESTIRTDFN